MSLLGAVVERLNTWITGPADMSGYDIYQQMRKNVTGTASLHAAAQSAQATNTRLAAAEQAMRSYQDAMAAGFQGASGDAARGSSVPIVDGMQRSQEDIDKFGQAAQGQADSFDRYSRTLIDVPKHKPSFWKRLGGMLNPFDGSNPGNDIDSYHEAVEHNKSAYRSYGGATQQYAGQLPGERHQQIGTDHNTGIDDPNRRQGQGYGGYDGYHGSAGNGWRPGSGAGNGPGTPGYDGVPNVHDPDIGGTTAAAFSPLGGAGFGSTGLGAGTYTPASGGFGAGSGSGFGYGSFGALGLGSGGGLGGYGSGAGAAARGAGSALSELAESGQGRGLAGRPGAGGIPAGGRGRKGKGDAEHRFAEYLVNEDNGSEIVGDVDLTAPPVIGE